jgi:hypothetical protein
VDLVNARQKLVQAQTDYSGSRYDYIVSMIQLRLAAGNLDRTEVVTMNGALTTSAPTAPTASPTPESLTPPPASPTPKRSDQSRYGAAAGRHAAAGRTGAAAALSGGRERRRLHGSAYRPQAVWLRPAIEGKAAWPSLANSPALSAQHFVRGYRSAPVALCPSGFASRSGLLRALRTSASTLA